MIFRSKGLRHAAAAIASLLFLGLAPVTLTACAHPRHLAAAERTHGTPAHVAPVHWPGLDAAATDRYRQAIREVDAGHYEEALALASHGPVRSARTLITWLWLTRPDGSAAFADYADFIAHHADWPGQVLLRRRAETALATDPDDAIAYDWLTRHPPLTGIGKLRLADAMLNRGQHEAGLAELRRAWIEGDFTAEQERALLQDHRGMLRATDQEARLERLLDDFEDQAARRQLLRVDAGWRALGEARLALQAGEGGVERLVDLVPKTLLGDPGLNLDRERWRRQKGLDDLAVAILTSPAAHRGNLERWWTERHIEARRALAAGKISLARRLACDSGLTRPAPGAPDKAYVTAQWLCGWIALRFLDEPQDSGHHFQAIYDVSRSPITRSRGAYWAARTAEALKHPVEAKRWYQRAARYPTAYYGQLALLHLAPGTRLDLPKEPEPTQAMRRAFDRRELVQVARLLAAVGQADRLHPFILRLDAEARTPDEHQMVAALADHLGRLDLGVEVARHAEREGDVLVRRDFPLPPLHKPPATPELPLLYAISRQESGFNPKVVSPAGAEGLMQLMPGTAKLAAAHLGLPFRPRLLTRDPHYNLRLGAAHLQSLIDRFDGNYLLAITAYNAGTTRVLQWMQQWGDPRRPGVDPIDWVELIPYSETRNYVERVLEGLQVYRRRLDEDRGRLRLARDLSGHAPRES